MTEATKAVDHAPQVKNAAIGLILEHGPRCPESGGLEALWLDVITLFDAAPAMLEALEDKSNEESHRADTFPGLLLILAEDLKATDDANLWQWAGYLEDRAEAIRAAIALAKPES